MATSCTPKEISRIADTVRCLSLDAIDAANSGHPGLPLGAADFAAVLWAKHLRFDPKAPNWMNRDRFVLSGGHGCMLWYSLLNLFGYDLPMSELKKFRQWESKTPGHPEFGMTPGIETTTGPLGQGISNSVGIALSGRMMAARYGEELFNHRVYALISDGDVMEGVAAEAASLAGHLGLANLICMYDDNLISLAGETKLCFSENVPKRFEAYGWFVQSVDGHDIAAVDAALEKAKAQTDKPSLICCRTTIAKGSPHKAGSFEAHGAPLGAEETKATKKNLGWPEDSSFFVPDDVKASCARLVEEKSAGHAAWQKQFNEWKKANSAKAEALDAQLARRLPATLEADLVAALSDPKKDATRNLSSKALQVIAQKVPYLVGGSADLDPSTKTALKDGGDVQKGSFAGRNIKFGVREHGMGAIVNGMAYQGCWIPYSATFLVFSDYMRPTVRLAALSHLQSLFIFTHDSFWVGEDGPTHEPIEHVMALRLIPNLYVFRPADGIEVAMSYSLALKKKNRPSTLIFTRQNVAPLPREAGVTAQDVAQGGYVVSGKAITNLCIVATGSEVGLACDAAKILAEKGIAARIVSLPCWELFKELPAAKQAEVIPPGARKVSIEAGSTNGWHALIGQEGLAIGIDHYGASAPGEVLAEKFGFTAPAVAAKIAAWHK